MEMHQFDLTHTPFSRHKIKKLDYDSHMPKNRKINEILDINCANYFPEK